MTVLAEHKVASNKWWLQPRDRVGKWVEEGAELRHFATGALATVLKFDPPAAKGGEGRFEVELRDGSRQVWESSAVNVMANADGTTPENHDRNDRSEVGDYLAQQQAAQTAIATVTGAAGRTAGDVDAARAAIDGVTHEERTAQDDGDQVAAARQAITDVTGRPQAPGPAMAQLPPGDQARVRHAVEDHAGRFHGGPGGMNRGDSARYVTEGPLKPVVERHGYDKVRAAVAEHIDAHPEHLDTSLSESDREKRKADRAAAVQPLGTQVAEALKVGDHDRAHAVVNDAEQAAPDAQDWDRVRGVIEAQRPKKPAGEPKPHAAAADPAAAPPVTKDDLQLQYSLGRIAAPRGDYRGPWTPATYKLGPAAYAEVRTIDEDNTDDADLGFHLTADGKITVTDPDRALYELDNARDIAQDNLDSDLGISREERAMYRSRARGLTQIFDRVMKDRQRLIDAMPDQEEADTDGQAGEAGPAAAARDAGRLVPEPGAGGDGADRRAGGEDRGGRPAEGDVPGEAVPAAAGEGSGRGDGDGGSDPGAPEAAGAGGPEADAAGSEADGGPDGIRGSQEEPGRAPASLTRREFLATPPEHLVHLGDDGTSITVAPKPAGMSDSTYRDHLASGPRLIVTTKPDGGFTTRNTGVEPESARIMVANADRRGETVTVQWENVPGVSEPDAPGGSAVGDATAEQQPAPDEAQLAAIPAGGQSFRPTGPQDLGQAGRKKAQVRANIDALRTLRTLQEEHRPATPEEQAVLARWAGWGNLPEAFDDAKPEYAAEREELQHLLSPAEMREARRNTLNAHYTDARAAQAMWSALRDAGFDGGRVLEPGSGAGTFIGLAPGDADMVGVELDSTTAAISKALYPHATIRNESFADTRAPAGSFDAVIGNVPYGKLPLTDKVHNRAGESIHNHFIIKSLDLVRPGGLVAVLTSRYTLDSRSSRARQSMADRGDLVAAIRLPTGSHSKTAGTDVIEDILIFRKRAPGEAPQEDQSWINSSQVEAGDPRLVGEFDPKVSLNDYWAAHPENVLGDIQIPKGQYGSGDVEVIGDKDMGDLPAALANAVGDARAAGLAGTPRPVGEALPDLVDADTGRHEGHIRANEDGSFSQATGGADVPLNVPDAQRAELRHLVGLRDTTSALLDAESKSGQDTPEIGRLRAKLNADYDAYVAEYGPINRFKRAKNGARNRPPQGGFRADPSSAMVKALETYDSQTGEATKTDIFTTRSVAPRQLRTKADTPQDALTLSLEQHGSVSLPAIARLLGTDEADARRQLGDLVWEQPPLTAAEENDAIQREIYQDLGTLTGFDVEGGMAPPDLSSVGESVRREGTLVPASEYLYGNVRRKLAVARAAARADDRFQGHVAALEKALPPELGIDEIEPRVGAVWVHPAEYQEFLQEITEDPTAQVGGAAGFWTVKGNRGGVLANETWGTPDKPAPALLELMLSQSPIKVTRTDPKTKTSYLDQEATDAASAKAEELQARFQEWVWEEPERARRLQQRYNDLFNAIALREYDDSERHYDGMSEEWQQKMRAHQRAAVQRIISEPAALLAHVVGAGKTAEMVTGAAELRRLGLARKPAMVVPNHMLEQATREALELYPAARVLSAGGNDLTGDRRREFVARAATGDWDLVIMTQGAFKKIPVSRDQMAAYTEKEMQHLRDELDRAKADAEANGDDDKSAKGKTIKKMENALANAEEALKEMLEADRDEGVSWEQTGIDYLMVDEAQDYLNLRTLSAIPGAGASGSKMATDLHMKLDYLRQSTETGRVATFATGTPIRNSVTQAYILMRYMRPDLLEQANIRSFDQWAATFGEVVQEMELKPEGKGFRQTARFAKFKNVPEFLRLFRTFTDVKTAEDLNLPTPTLRTGKPQIVTVPRTDALAAYINDLGERAQAVRDGKVKPEEDNMLKISTEGRKAALSMKLVGGEHEPGKLEAAADKIAEIHAANKDRVYTDRGGRDSDVPGALQIVFMDLGTPKDAKAKDEAASVDDNDSNWNGYDHLKAELIARGVPADGIRYMHEAKTDEQKADMFAAARSGRISVLIGSTAKMGVGTNVQDRAVAMHHIDAPWRPADVEQRDGRIMRQGNQNEEIDIFRYVTEGSFDAYMWQTLERKAKFINQVIKGRLDVREIEDVGDTALNYAEIKALATGNPDLLEKAKVDTLVSKLDRLERAFNRSQSNLRRNRELYTSQIAQNRQKIAEMDAVLPKLRDTRGKAFQMRVGPNSYTDRGQAMVALRRQLTAQIEQDRHGERPKREIGELAGLPLEAQVIRQFDGKLYSTALYLGGQRIAWYDQKKIADGTVPQLILPLENGAARLPAVRQESVNSIAAAEEEIARINTRVGGTFARAEELSRARRKAARLSLKLQRDAKRGEGEDIPYDPVVDSDQYDEADGDLPDLPDLVPEEAAAGPESPRRFATPGAWINHAQGLGARLGGYGDDKKRGQYLTRTTKTLKNVTLSDRGGLVVVKDKTGKWDVLPAGISASLTSREITGHYGNVRTEEDFSAFEDQANAQAFANYLEATARDADGNLLDWSADNIAEQIQNFPKSADFEKQNEWLLAFRGDFDRARGITPSQYTFTGPGRFVKADNDRRETADRRRAAAAKLANTGLDDTRWKIAPHDDIPQAQVTDVRPGDVLATQDQAGGAVYVPSYVSKDNLGRDDFKARTVAEVTKTGSWNERILFKFTDGTTSNPQQGTGTVRAHPDGYPGTRPQPAPPPAPEPPAAAAPEAPAEPAAAARDAIDTVTGNRAAGEERRESRNTATTAAAQATASTPAPQPAQEPAAPAKASERPPATDLRDITTGWEQGDWTKVGGYLGGDGTVTFGPTKTGPLAHPNVDFQVVGGKIVGATEKNADGTVKQRMGRMSAQNLAQATTVSLYPDGHWSSEREHQDDPRHAVTAALAERIRGEATAREQAQTAPAARVDADLEHMADQVNAAAGTGFPPADLAGPAQEAMRNEMVRLVALNQHNHKDDYNLTFDPAMDDVMVNRTIAEPTDPLAKAYWDAPGFRDAYLEHARDLAWERIRDEGTAEPPVAAAATEAPDVAEPAADRWRHDTVTGLPQSTVAQVQPGDDLVTEGGVDQQVADVPLSNFEAVGLHPDAQVALDRREPRRVAQVHRIGPGGREYAIEFTDGGMTHSLEGHEPVWAWREPQPDTERADPPDVPDETPAPAEEPTAPNEPDTSPVAAAPEQATEPAEAPEATPADPGAEKAVAGFTRRELDRMSWEQLSDMLGVVSDWNGSVDDLMAYMDDRETREAAGALGDQPPPRPAITNVRPRTIASLRAEAKQMNYAVLAARLEEHHRNGQVGNIDAVESFRTVLGDRIYNRMLLGRPIPARYLARGWSERNLAQGRGQPRLSEEDMLAWFGRTPAEMAEAGRGGDDVTIEGLTDADTFAREYRDRIDTEHEFPEYDEQAAQDYAEYQRQQEEDAAAAAGVEPAAAVPDVRPQEAQDRAREESPLPGGPAEPGGEPEAAPEPDANDAPETPPPPDKGNVGGVTFEQTPRGLVLGGDTFPNKDAIKDAGFVYREQPGGKRDRKGRPVKEWRHEGAPAERAAALQQLRDAIGGEPDGVGDEQAEKYPPTPQQQAVIDAVLTGEDTVVRALAGTGKTSTLQMIARRMPEKRIIYVAFNKSVQTEASQRMPSNVEARTADSLAFRAAPKSIRDKFTRQKNGSYDERGLRRNDEVAAELRITRSLEMPEGGEPMSPDEQAAAVIKTVENFAISADPVIDVRHVPEAAEPVDSRIVELARTAWKDIQNPDGALRITNSHITKMWALSGPDLRRTSSGVSAPVDVVFFDEGQDINDVLAEVVFRQDMQKVLVGDSNQAIYGFRGARDQLSEVDFPHDLPLTKSWRFGPEVADAGNRFLEMLDSPHRVEGGGGPSTVVDTGTMDVKDADAVLVRSNAGAVREILTAQGAGRLVGVPKGTKQDLQRLADTARWLQREGPMPSVVHDDLAPYRSWKEVTAAAEKTGDPKLTMLTRIVEDNGVQVLDRMARDLIELGTDHRTPDLVVSTAHKAKGLEWDRVKIGSDFRGPEIDEETGKVKKWPEPEELRLAYVAVTRARKNLDPGALAWVYEYTGGNSKRRQDQATADVPETPAAPDVQEATAAPEPAAATGEEVRPDGAIQTRIEGGERDLTDADRFLISQEEPDRPATDGPGPDQEGLFDAPQREAPARPRQPAGDLSGGLLDEIPAEPAPEPARAEEPAAPEPPAIRERVPPEELRVGDTVEGKLASSGERGLLRVESVSQQGRMTVVTGRRDDGTRDFIRTPTLHHPWRVGDSDESAESAWQRPLPPDNDPAGTGQILPADLKPGDVFDAYRDSRDGFYRQPIRLTFIDAYDNGSMRVVRGRDSAGDIHEVHLAKGRPVPLRRRGAQQDQPPVQEPQALPSGVQQAIDDAPNLSTEDLAAAARSTTHPDVRDAYERELADRGYDPQGRPVVGGRADMTAPAHPADLGEGTRVFYRAGNRGGADDWVIGTLERREGPWMVVRSGSDGRPLQQVEVDAGDWVDPVTPGDPRIGPLVLASPGDLDGWSPDEMDAALAEQARWLGDMAANGLHGTETFQRGTEVYDRLMNAAAPADEPAAPEPQAAPPVPAVPDVVERPRLDEIQARPPVDEVHDDDLTGERSRNQDRMLSLHRDGRGDGDPEFDLLRARQDTIAGEQERRTRGGLDRPVDNTPAYKLEQGNRVLLDVAGQTGVYEISSRPRRTGGTVRFEITDENGARQDYELSDADAVLTADPDTPLETPQQEGPSLDDVATFDDFEPDAAPEPPPAPEPTPEPAPAPEPELAPPGRPARGGPPRQRAPRPPRPRKPAAPLPAGVPEIEQHEPGTTTARPVLYTYQRKNVVALGLDLDEDASPVLRQAAARVRTRKVLSAEQAAALADAVRARAESQNLRVQQRRAMHRLAWRMDAAAAEANGEPPPDLPAAAVVRSRPADIGAGDRVALPGPSGLLQGVVVATRSMMKGRLHEITVEQPDGSRESRLVTAATDTYVLPDAPDPEPVVPAGRREVVPATDLRAGDRVLLRSWNGDIEATVTGQATDERGDTRPTLDYRPGARDYGILKEESTGQAAVLGTNSVVRLERGPGSVGQPAAAVYVPAADPEPVAAADLRVGDYVDVRQLSGSRVVGWVAETGDGRLTIHQEAGGPFPRQGITAPGTATITRLGPWDQGVELRLRQYDAERHLAARTQQISLWLERPALDAAKQTHNWFLEPGADLRSGDDVDAWIDGLEVHLAQRGPEQRTIAGLDASISVPGQEQPGLMSPAAVLAAEVYQRTSDAIVQALREAVPVGGDQDRAAAVSALLDVFRDNPPTPIDIMGASESLARARAAAQAMQPPGGDVAPVTSEAGDLEERLGAYRDSIGGEFGRATHRVPIPVIDSIDDLAAGKVPDIEWHDVPRSAPAGDGGPSADAMRHHAIIRAAGQDVDRRLQQVLVNANYPAGHVRPGEHPEAALARHRQEVADAIAALPADDAEIRAKMRQNDITSLSIGEQERHPALHALIDLETRLERLSTAIGKARRAAALQVLQNLGVEMGGQGLNYYAPGPAGREPRLTERGGLVKAMRFAEASYPAAWLQAARQHQEDRHGGVTLLRERTRAQHAPGALGLSTVKDNVGAGQFAPAAVHELGHVMEEAIPGLFEAEQAMLWERLSSGQLGERTMPNPTVVGNPRDREIAYPGFPDTYTGRIYRGQRHAEVFTTAMQGLFGGSHEYLDDDLRQWALGVLVTLGPTSGR